MGWFVRKVHGQSMLPTLKPGAYVLARTDRKKLSVGDIVIFRRNEREMIKRVSIIAPDGLFLLGDNATYSTDSRTYGWIQLEQICGRVIWPRGLSALSALQNDDRGGPCV